MKNLIGVPLQQHSRTYIFENNEKLGFHRCNETLKLIGLSITCMTTGTCLTWNLEKMKNMISYLMHEKLDMFP